MNLISGRLARTAGVALGIAGTLAASASPALAFCGFYVAQADSKLFNKASKVVLAHDGDHTAITMASDYQGDPKEFALVIPVPVVVQKDDIHTVDPVLIDRIDAYSAPRLTEYSDPNPCREPMITWADDASRAVGSAAHAATTEGKALGVTVEAKYEVGIYDILVLSAKESDGLVAWLKENQYRIPEGAEDVLGSYIRQGMHFFVAKVNLGRQAESGTSFLEPLQVGYNSRKFMLPIRLGTVNASGPQDLILLTITRQGRVETMNYRTAKMATRVDVPVFVRDDFGAVYKAAFDRAVENDGMRSIFLEYAWDLTANCDPCSGTPPVASELVTLGASWLNPTPPPSYVATYTPTLRQPVRPPDPTQLGFITRLHVRYDRAHFPEDLALMETDDRRSFQVVYALHYTWIQQAACPAGDEYRKSLRIRFAEEANNLSDLTGWPIADIKTRMDKEGETAAATAR
jgi:hypothetical protein